MFVLLLATSVLDKITVRHSAYLAKVVPLYPTSDLFRSSNVRYALQNTSIMILAINRTYWAIAVNIFLQSSILGLELIEWVIKAEVSPFTIKYNHMCSKHLSYLVPSMLSLSLINLKITADSVLFSSTPSFPMEPISISAQGSSVPAKLIICPGITHTLTYTRGRELHAIFLLRSPP